MYKTPEQRYCHDVMFKSLVDLLEHQIHQAQYTPSEIRDAAMLVAFVSRFGGLPKFAKIAEAINEFLSKEGLKK